MNFNAPFAKLKVENRNKIMLEKELRELGAERITAGIHREQGSQMVSENARLIDIAVQNEYGNEWVEPKTISFEKNGKWYHIKKGTVVKIPATRFVSRLLADTDKRKDLILTIQVDIDLMLKSYKDKYGEKVHAKKVIRSIGEYMKSRIKGYIDNKDFEPNALMTVEGKGFDKRLFDKGILYDNIKWRSKKQKSE